MTARFRFSALVASLTVAAAPLAAQQTSLATATPIRIVANYNFSNAPRDIGFPRSVTVADSAGSILASVEIANRTRAIPMTVTVIESSLVLQGETADGLLTLVLDRQNEGGAMILASGTWTLGKLQGQLRASDTR